MKNDIVEKLRVELKKPIQTEAQVVYVLVELRKIIEQSEHGSRYLSVLLFCDWAVHVEMSRQSAFNLLQEIDRAIERAATNTELAELIGNKLSMDTFRDDLIHILMDHELPSDIARTMHGWLAFLPLYLRVIEDCPVLTRKVGLRHLDRLTVRLDREPPDEVPAGALFAFAIVWTFSKAERTVLEWRNDVFYPKEYKPGRFYQLHSPKDK